MYPILESEVRVMKTKEIKDILGHAFDSVSKYKGVFTARKGFYYRHGHTEEMSVDEVRSKLPEATIFDSGEIWKAFNGGALLKNQSHWFVKFTV